MHGKQLNNKIFKKKLLRIVKKHLTSTDNELLNDVSAYLRIKSDKTKEKNLFQARPNKNTNKI